MLIACVGSRNYPDQDRVERFVTQLLAKYPGAVVLSGRARGPDTWSEKQAEALGGHVTSLRPFGPTEYEGEWVWTFEPQRMYGIHRYENGEKVGDRWALGVYENYRDAAYARNTFVAQECARLVAWIAHRDDGSGRWTGGTYNTISEARRFGRPRTVYDEFGSRVAALEL